MAPARHTNEEEETFMNSILGSLDAINDSPCFGGPSPDPSSPKTPTKNQRKCSPLKRSHTSPSKVFSAGDVDMSSFLEGAENWDMDSWDIDPFTPKKPSPKKKVLTLKEMVLPTYASESCTRCIVHSVVETEESGRWHKVLVTQVDSSEERRRVILKDDWVLTDVRVGDVMNVLGEFEPISPSSSSLVSSISITSQANMIILHPDLLLTATALSNALQCRRKALISSLIRSSSDTTAALLWGNMLHEIMQACLGEGRWEETWINERIEEAVNKNLLELVKLDLTIEQAKREVNARAKGLQTFAARYLSDTPKPDAILMDTRAKAHQAPSLLAISNLLDVEEDIWSPTYGLKGKLDATVDTVTSDPTSSQSNFFKTTDSVITRGPQPFEIKTGRTVAGMEHRAQTMLYTLLASERYGTPVSSGLLYYTQSDEVVRVPSSRNELRGLFQARNELAAYQMRRNRNLSDEGGVVNVSRVEIFLPPTLDDERLCKKCYSLDACMLYRKAIDGPMDQFSPIYDTYELKTSHLTSSQTAFFRKWESLLAMEEQDLVRFKKELWTLGAAERERRGRCLAGMVLDETFIVPVPDNMITTGESKIHKFSYRFFRTPGWGTEHGLQKGASLLNGHLNAGDAITVSVEPHLLALARGFIVELTPSEVIVGVDHIISRKTIEMRMGITKEIIFRIDKDELFGGMGRIRDNLAQLFYAEGDTRRLRLVVDLKAPSFVPNYKLPPFVEKHTTMLNANQRAAVSKVLSADDYALILGMPGTGKTTVTAALIKALVEMGKTVLLTSYTHSAVDTILLKLDDADFGILRLGNADKIHPNVQKYTLAARRKATTIEELERQLMSPPVVATTCLTVDHALFTRRKFDYCIVDEASQITLPTCLGPLRYAETFVLVGDHFQLPPLVRNKDARKGGLDVSLFRRLSDAHPAAVVDLASQYRMNEDIMILSNKLIYSDRLRCGSEEVAKRSLVLPNKEFLNRLHSPSISTCREHDRTCWIEHLASESCKAVFVDTDLVPAQDSRVGDLVQNETEASLVLQLTETLLQSGVREDQIGIISLYRQQVKLLTHLLHARSKIEILTADRSQGRDKDCIIISMVRSNDSGQVGDLLKDWRRINVSFTRARSKLIIIGSRKTLQSTDLLSQFLRLMEERNWIIQLPPNADKLHSEMFSNNCSTPTKRIRENLELVLCHTTTATTTSKENQLETHSDRPQKKLKIKRTDLDSGILRGRPILQDLVNGNM